MSAGRIRFLRPSVPALDEVTRLYEEIYGTGLLTNGTLVKRFENACAKRLGVRHCVAVSSCTSGMMLVWKALTLAGEVILPSFTFFASGHAVRWNHLDPVFADIDPDTWTVDPASVERCITPRTRAILGVHLYGNPCDVEGLQDVASRHGLRLVFDAAHAFGSEWQGTPVGCFGDAEVFSFTPTKTLVCGEGGIVATNDSALAHRVRAGRNYGDLGAYDPELLGMNARMQEFPAAMGLAGLTSVSAKVARHNQIARMYQDALRGLPGISFPVVRPGNLCTFKDVSLGIDDPDRVAAMLLEEGIETKRYFYPPLHEQALYRSQPDVPHTRHIAQRVLSLPVYESLTEQEVERIISALAACVQSGPAQPALRQSAQR